MNARAGYTLVELLIVITILSVLLGIVFGFGLRSLRTSELREAATSISTDLIGARSSAQKRSEDVPFSFPRGSAGSTYRIGTRTHTLPGGVTVVCTANCGALGANVTNTYTAPFGELQNAGQVLSVQRGGVRPFEVRIVGVTGKVIITRTP